MTNREPKRSASRNVAIHQVALCLFFLSALCGLVSVFVVTPEMARTMLYFGFAVFALFGIVCKLISSYVILPPTNDTDGDGET